MNHYEARQEARRERLLGAADKAEGLAAASFRKADLREEVSGIPLGQPILVGHHSERRHRNAIARADAAMRRSIEAAKRAKDLRAKAAGVGTAGISSEDPEAVDKIVAKVAKLEADQAQMKAANAVIRAFYKAGVRNAESGDPWPRYLEKIREVLPNVSEHGAAELLKPDCCGRIGFPDYALQNNNANIRRLKARVPQVQAVQQAEDKAEQIGAITYREEDARVWLVFPGKPAEEIRAELRRNAFKWSPTRGAWVRQLSNAARYHGRQIAERAGGAA